MEKTGLKCELIRTEVAPPGGPRHRGVSLSTQFVKRTANMTMPQRRDIMETVLLLNG